MARNSRRYKPTAGRNTRKDVQRGNNYITKEYYAYPIFEEPARTVGRVVKNRIPAAYLVSELDSYVRDTPQRDTGFKVTHTQLTRRLKNKIKKTSLPLSGGIVLKKTRVTCRRSKNVRRAKYFRARNAGKPVSKIRKRVHKRCL